MSKFEESKFYKSLQDFFINNNKDTFLQFIAEFYNRTEGIIDKNKIQDDLIKELRELYLEFNEKGIDENIVREKVNYFVENNVKIKDILAKLVINTNKIEDNTEKLNTNTNNIKNISSQLDTNTNNIENITSQLDTKASEYALVVERRRIDNIVAQPPTKDNVETVDIRVGANGETYGSAGESVRSQYKDILDVITIGNKRIYTNWAEGFVNNKGITTAHRQMITSVDFIELDESGIDIDVENGYQYTVHYETKDGGLKLGTTWFTEKNHFSQYKDNTTTNRIRVTIYDSSFVGNMTIDYCNKIYLKQKKYKTIKEVESKITYFENKSFINDLFSK